MSEEMPFVGEPADSREAIMRATYLALHEHGYAGLSIQRIADEADLSKSTFYHHYDDKDDLLTSFVDFTLEEFMRVFSLEAGEDPRDNLRTLVYLLIDPEPDLDRELPEDLQAIFGTYVELRAQAVRDETIRQKFTEADEVFTSQIAEIVRAGVKADVFVPVDPERTARFIATVLAGTLFRRTTRERYDADALRSEFDAYVQARLEP
jgi:AcrR family transcriptional regulator